MAMLSRYMPVWVWIMCEHVGAAGVLVWEQTDEGIR